MSAFQWIVWRSGTECIEFASTWSSCNDSESHATAESTEVNLISIFASSTSYHRHPKLRLGVLTLVRPTREHMVNWGLCGDGWLIRFPAFTQPLDVSRDSHVSLPFAIIACFVFFFRPLRSFLSVEGKQTTSYSVTPNVECLTRVALVSCCCCWSGFQSSFKSKLCFLWFALLRSLIGQQNSRHFFSQWQANPIPISTCTRAFSRSLHRLHVIASYYDWLIALYASALIGQSNYFGWSPLAWVFATDFCMSFADILTRGIRWILTYGKPFWNLTTSL